MQTTMDKTMDNSLKEYQDEMARKRRINNLILAFIRRGKEAGIPNAEMRIGKDEFQSLLDKSYHLNVEDFATGVYSDANVLMSKSFVLIDGANMYIRRKAAFALLFRMITFDYSGKHFSCSDVCHKLQIASANPEISRNELAEDLKGYDVLLLTEFYPNIFQKGFEVQTFWDEILESRDIAGKPTIITFVNPISKDERFMLSDISLYGQYMCMLSQIGLNPLSNVLRVRVGTKDKE